MKHSDDSLLLEIGELLVRAMDNALSKEEFERLATLLKENPAAREYYYDTLVTFAGVDEIGIPALGDSGIDMVAWKAMADIERTAPAVVIEKNKQKSEAVLHAEQAVKIARKVNKASIIVAITSLAALILMIVFVNYGSSFTREDVATLTDSFNAVWSESNLSSLPDTRFAARQGILTLEQGLVKFQFDTNAKVIVEAPAKFEFLTAEQIQLYSGRIYASVPPEAVGFTIKTSNSKIVDLGTEFGVQADYNGNTELHVLKGKTSLICGSQNKTSTMLTEGAAKRITGTEARLSDIQCDQDRFVREINSEKDMIWRGQPIQLADIAGNGDGFGTGSAKIGINPVTGQTGPVTPLDRNASNAYKILVNNPFIDGVFVPNGKTPQVISSQGHVFEECPATCGNFYLEIANSLINPWTSKTEFDTIDHSFLLLHANAGITYDLAVIRSQVPDLKISRFDSQLRISQTAPDVPNCDFWILVDGKVRYSKRNVTQRDFADTVSVKLSDGDRFLTLVATDGQDPENRILSDGSIMKSINSDWCVFDKPVLVLE